MKHSEKNCYQQHIFVLINKKMQIGSSSNLGNLRDGRLVTRPLQSLSIKDIFVAVSRSELPFSSRYTPLLELTKHLKINFFIPFLLVYLQSKINGFVAQLNRALDYGSRG
jgi:hypothetical protein